MKTAMRESQLKESQMVMLSERNKRADMLVEKWSKKKGIGEGLQEAYDSDPGRIRNLSIVLENQSNHLKRLTETQISNAFQTTPENVMRIVRLGYPNSVRGEIFLDWAMETARDSIYYLSPIYGSSLRGSTATEVTHEQGDVWRYASELELATLTGTPNGALTTFTGSNAGNVANPPIRPFTLRIIQNGQIIGTDDGAGNLVGALLDTTASSIDYTTGALTVEFLAAPVTGTVLQEQYSYDSEVASQYTDLGDVELQLRDFLFRAKPWPLGVSWSKMTELLLGTTLDIDAEEALIRGAADEIKKSLDSFACREGYRYALANTQVTFDADFASAGADSEVAHAQSISRKIADAGDVIYAAANRGGVSVMYGATDAVNYLKLHRLWSDEGRQPAVGIHRVGTLDGVPVYKTPAAVVPNGDIVCVWKNESVPEDVSIAFGTLIPLYQTQTLEFKEMYKELGLAHFGDWKALQPRYMVRLTLSNL